MTAGCNPAFACRNFSGLDEFPAILRRESIAPTMAELERLGWIEVYRGGYRGFARSMPNRFRLTARRTLVSPGLGEPYFAEATNE
jgi:hypothetical protein